MKTNKLQQLMYGTQEALAKANASNYFQELLKTVSRQFIIYAGEHGIDSFNSDVGLQFLEDHYAMSQRMAEKKWCSMASQQLFQLKLVAGNQFNVLAGFLVFQ